jgi:hypothetical protein
VEIFTRSYYIAQTMKGANILNVVHDRNIKLMTSMTKDIFGKLFSDKGYISKALADLLWGNGIQMITKPQKT